MLHTYQEFFEEEKRGLPYESRETYTGDLLIFADACLDAACERKNRSGERFLTGVPAYSGFLDDSLVSGGPGREEAISMEETLELHRMLEHIGERAKAAGGKTQELLWLDAICGRFRLNRWERFALLLSSVNHYDRKYERIFAYLQDDGSALYPTLGLARSLYFYLFPGTEEKKSGRTGKRLFDGPLLKPQAGEGAFSVLAVPLRLRREILEYLGLLPESGEGGSADGKIPSVIHEKQEQEMEALFQIWRREEEKEGCLGLPGFLHLYGDGGNGKHFSLGKAAAKAGARLEFLDCGRFGAAKETLEQLESAALKARLSGAWLCLDLLNPPPEMGTEEADAYVSAMIRKAARLAGRFVVLSDGNGKPYILPGISRTEAAFPLLTAPERGRIWELESRGCRLEPEVSTEYYAGQYLLTAGQIGGVIAAAKIRAAQEGREQIGNGDILHGISVCSPRQLGRFAVQKNAAFTWEDLILDEGQKRIMGHICSQFRYRDKVRREWGFEKKSPYGNGISAIFYGAPGTGKTMAAQVIANELGIDLYRVDISQLVSKYIGETEKNMSELFERAQNINALLFFDEADALFSKRTDVRDSHDRNANAETAHLLQLFEEYGGITILATNYFRNVDEAFKRRIKFSVNFQLPNGELRLKLWNSMITDQVKAHSTLDTEFFAGQFELSGSSIKEVITNGAYMAAAEGVWPDNRHMVESMKLHYQKMGKILTDREFGYLAAGKAEGGV